jgi:hypothetical protein
VDHKLIANTTTAVEELHAEEENLKMFHFPNPASTIATIKYTLPFDGQVSFKMYDLLGREICTITETKKVGGYTTPVDVSALKQGLYYYTITLRTEKKVFRQSQKMTVIK